MARKNPLFFAFFFPALVDSLLTLISQGNQYWNVNRTVNEASPAYYFLLVSPWLFLFGSAVWFISWYWLIKRLKEPYNLFLMFLFLAGHFWGSSSWVMKLFKENGFYTLNNQPSIIFNWSLLILYLALVSIIATHCLRRYLGLKTKRIKFFSLKNFCQFKLYYKQSQTLLTQAKNIQETYSTLIQS